MQIEHLFGGSALAAVDGKGRVRLPRFVRDVAARRSGSQTLVLGPHEKDPCLTGYDPSYRRALFEDSERLRLRDETLGSEANHRRARRAFGLTEQAEVDAEGWICLPLMARRLGRIEDLALFLGTGATFEIWDPRVAAQSDDPALAELARWRLGDDRLQHHERED